MKKRRHFGDITVPPKNSIGDTHPQVEAAPFVPGVATPFSVPAGHDWATVGGLLSPVEANNPSYSIYFPAQASNPSGVQVTLGPVDATGAKGVAVAIRAPLEADNNNDAGYYLVLTGGQGAAMNGCPVNGPIRYLASDLPHPAAGQQWLFRAAGSTLTISVDGSVVWTGTDSLFASGRVFLYSDGNGYGFTNVTLL